MKIRLFTALAVMIAAANAQAALKVPNVFGNHMVVQQKAPIKVWGWTNPGQEVTVSLADKSVSGKANADGRFDVSLPELTAGGPHQLTIKADETVTFEDVLVGEVWICSGQSNMQWSINASNDPDLEKLTAKNTNIRMINFPQVGTQEPILTHDRQWQVTSPETVGTFSAVGYFFARQIQETTGVPVGMINNAWGGSACEAWINRDVLKADEKYAPLLERWAGMEAKFAELSAKTELTEDEKKALQQLKGQMGGNSRPANIYNGVLKSHLGYTIKGAIWYQGESNASRAYQYRDLFPLMISNWRSEWGQGDFPFYWVQLADFQAEPAGPSESTWAELREAQTMSVQALPHSGQAVIIDLGEAADIHPRNKAEVAKRLARLALAQDYGVSIVHRSPRYASMETQGNKIVVSFEDRGGGIRTVDKHDVVGFWIAGEDRQWKVAQAKVVDGQKVEVWNDEVAKPVAVRYAWADNPVCNLFNAEGLPVTPFRTDDWPGITADAK